LHVSTNNQHLTVTLGNVRKCSVNMSTLFTNTNILAYYNFLVHGFGSCTTTQIWENKNKVTAKKVGYIYLITT